MRTAVIYYSLEGNMDCVAQKIGENGTTDLYRLIPKTEYLTGNTVVGMFSFVNPLQRQDEDFHQKIERIQSLMAEK